VSARLPRQMVSVEVSGQSWVIPGTWQRNLAHAGPVDQADPGTLHHIEVWVNNLDRAVASWGWLLTELGYEEYQDWPGGRSWKAGHTYIVFEQSPARTASRHDRLRPGVNHLAFHLASRAQADKLATAAPGHGWRLMFADRHPYAGGEQHYAAYLENADGFEVELVAPDDDPDNPWPEERPWPAEPGSAGAPGQASPGGSAVQGESPGARRSR
jgi:catechol 2,3-dioxygenase-like lactoylglutathione lyase family enzyme